MKLIASFLTAALMLSVAGVASADPREVRETRSQPPREVRERPVKDVKERVVVQREHRETQAREATSTRSGGSSVVSQGKQLVFKVCMRGPQECR